MATLREMILAANDLPREKVTTDEWAPFGVPFVHVRGLTSAERDAYEMSLLITKPNGDRVANPKLRNIKAGFVARVLVDENGERVFTDSQIAEIAGKSANVIERIWAKGRELSGMRVPDDDEDDEGTEEEANPSSGDQEDSPSSDSPSPSE